METYATPVIVGHQYCAWGRSGKQRSVLAVAAIAAAALARGVRFLGPGEEGRGWWFRYCLASGFRGLMQQEGL